MPARSASWLARCSEPPLGSQNGHTGPQKVGFAGQAQKLFISLLGIVSGHRSSPLYFKFLFSQRPNFACLIILIILVPHPKNSDFSA